MFTGLSDVLPMLLDTNCGCKMPEHKAAGWKTPIWDVYRQIITEGNGGVAVEFEEVERSVRALQCRHNSCEEQDVLKDLAVTWEKLSQVVAWCVRCGNTGSRSTNELARRTPWWPRERPPSTATSY